MARTISRRQFAQLGVLTLVGLGVGQILRRTAPIGRDVGDKEATRAVLQDGVSPSQEVEQPTLTLVIFTDYRCPACKLANDAMEAALIQDKHVRVIYRDWPIFGPMSERAARVAIASDLQGIYPAVHSQFMRERRALDEGVLRQAIEKSGGDWAQIEADLQTQNEAINRQLERNRQDAFQLGISGTPSYLAGPILVAGAQDQAGFRRLFAAGRGASEV